MLKKRRGLCRGPLPNCPHFRVACLCHREEHHTMAAMLARRIAVSLPALDELAALAAAEG